MTDTLTLIPLIYDSGEYGSLGCCQSRINGNDIQGENLSIDLLEVARSLMHEGDNFAIYGCGCGSPECAYVDQRTKVRHDGNAVLWRMKLPVAYSSPGDSDSLEEALEKWNQTATEVVFSFDREELATELQSAIEWLLENAQDNFSPHGTERVDMQRVIDQLTSAQSET